MEFHFLRPLWLLALLPMLFLLWRLWQRQAQNGSWNRIIDPAFQPILLQDTPEEKPFAWPLLGLTLLWTLTILALSGPTWHQVKMPAEKNLQGTVIVMDLSLSMLADDLKPNRLSRAQFKLRDLLKTHPEMAVGMVVYAGTAHTLAPISQDNQTLLSLLSSLTPTMMPRYGSEPLVALQLAQQLLEGANIKQGHIIWITDDIEARQTPAIQRFLNQHHNSLAIYAIGTQQGGPVTIPDFGLLKDEAGRIVLPKLPLDKLQHLAKEVNARLVTLQLNDDDIDALLPPSIQGIQGQENLEGQHPGPLMNAWIEEGVWLMFALVPLAALAFRRGWLLSGGLVLPLLCLSLWTVPTPPAFAEETTSAKNTTDLSFTDAFATPDRLGYLMWEKQDYARAETRFESPAWKGASLYRLGKFAKAAEQFRQVKTADGHYNLGNALAQQGQFSEAKDAYETALKLKPNMESAKHNLALMEKLLASQEPKSSPQQSSQQPSASQSSSQPKDQAGQNKSAQNSNDLQDHSSKNPQDKNAQQDANKSANQPNKQAQPNADQSQGADEAQQSGQADKSRADPNASNAGQAKTSKSPNDLDKSPQATADTPQKIDENKEGASDQAAAKLDDKADKPLPTSSTLDKALAGKTEQQQATQTWLNQIPDDPGLFLKRKFDYQYQQQAPRGNTAPSDEKIW